MNLNQEFKADLLATKDKNYAQDFMFQFNLYTHGDD